MKFRTTCFLLFMLAGAFVNAQSDTAQAFYVARNEAVIAPLKMNVLYVGVDNPLRIAVPGVASANVTAILEGAGKLVKERDGTYNANVTAVGMCWISVYVAKGGKPNLVSRQEFRCKRIPDPIATLGGNLRGGNMTPGVLKVQTGIVVRLEGFDFDIRINVLRFTMTVNQKGVIQKMETGGPKLSGEMQRALKSLQKGDVVIFSDITTAYPDSDVRKLNDLVFTVIE